MTNQEIYDLIARFDHSSLQTLRLSKQDFSIELSRSSAQSPAPSAPAAGIIRTSKATAIRKLEIRRRRFKGHPSFLTVILP